MIRTGCPVKGLGVHTQNVKTLYLMGSTSKQGSCDSPPPDANSAAPVPKKLYFHYNHTDAYKLSRWTAKECYQFTYSRPWQKINDFYLDMVNGCVSLPSLFGKEKHTVCDDSEIIENCGKPELVNVRDEARTGRWARVTFKITLSYHGASFDGWQKQPGLNTVQGLIERSLGDFVDKKKAEMLEEKNLPIEGSATVAGRTDKGVTAFQQVCSFYTWRKDVKVQDIKNAIDKAAPGKIRVISVAEVSREFHPNFSAKWRRYLYIFPIRDGELGAQDIQSDKIQDYNESDVCEQNQNGEDIAKTNGSETDEDNEVEMRNKPTCFKISRVDQLLRQLEGKLLSYKMFARDTKASRNTGPPTECFIFHARAAEVSLPCTKTMCIELVANRFLRKMVRVLVATAIREAAAGANNNALLNLMDATCRRATAPPAPPDGLSLVDVGYTEFEQKHCLIP